MDVWIEMVSASCLPIHSFAVAKPDRRVTRERDIYIEREREREKRESE